MDTARGLIKRLEDVSGWEGDHGDVGLCMEASAEIKRLRELLKELFMDWTTLVGEDLKENNQDVASLWQRCEEALAEGEANGT